MSKNHKHSRCLNCQTIVTGNYCQECGQSADTARFHFIGVLTKDFLKKILYYDKGLFYTIKELLTRPGHSVREYIEGKRVKHLHYISLIVILVIVFKLVEGITPFHYALLATDNKEDIDYVEHLLKNHAKAYFLAILPFFALFSFLFFRKAGLNYTEHFVINTFRGSAFLFFNIVFLVVASFLVNLTILLQINRAILYGTIAYGTWFYVQLFSPYYQNKYLLTGRSFLAVIVPMIIVIIAMAVYLVNFVEPN